jgi:hypothetical protein
VLPDFILEDVMKMNGVEFYNQPILIQDGDASDDTQDAPQQQDVEDVEEPILFMMLDCRSHPDLNFPTVKEYEVCDALNIEFADDIQPKKLRTMYGKNLGTFRIEAQDMTKYVGRKLVIRGHEIDLVPIRKQRREDPGPSYRARRNYEKNTVKVRIFEAWSNQFSSIDHSQFDEYFQKTIGTEIVIPTQPERCRERREIFTTNRYIVVRTEDSEGKKIDLGERIIVAGRTFNISYFGKQHYCGLCKTRHGWNCPSQIRHDFLRKLRQGKTDKCKIYSDSTLRMTNQLALTSDVACMTGGAIGQLCNVVPYDSPHEEIIINAGTNELKCNNLHEFVYTVEQEKKKVEKLASTLPVTLVLPQESNTDPESIVKSRFLRNAFDEHENVKVVKLSGIEIEDGHGHPTDAGTLEILKQIHALQKIVMKDCMDDAIAPGKYKCVQSLFRTGCRGCDSLQYTQYLCNDCRNAAKETDIVHLQESIKTLHEEMFPQPAPTDIEMMENKGMKRPSSDDDGSSNKKQIPS